MRDNSLVFIAANIAVKNSSKKMPKRYVSKFFYNDFSDCSRVNK